MGSVCGRWAAGSKVRVAKYEVKPSGRAQVTKVPDGKMKTSPRSVGERSLAETWDARYREERGIWT